MYRVAKFIGIVCVLSAGLIGVHELVATLLLNMPQELNLGRLWLHLHPASYMAAEGKLIAHDLWKPARVALAVPVWLFVAVGGVFLLALARPPREQSLI
ncbi:hypothetical protein [Marinivivus vitaminiproducens]|uniref:hypothetical protein n=1 Tax=Marinivivus vitaminiproducens TaxID=3035935 RepID=UPI00279D611D|nr:hypothetical protein P4R82_02205 [Geminicoccaceae bacterium SCSIO 64248]